MLYISIQQIDPCKLVVLKMDSFHLKAIIVYDSLSLMHVITC